jgi:gas vesicle protein
MKKALSFVIGAVVGGLVGATLAMLFAPESGSELRLQIRDRAGAFGEEIRHAVTSKRIELQDRLESMRAPKTQ